MPYDRDDRTKEVTEVREAGTNRPFVTEVAREPFGPVKSLSFGSGQRLTQTFNQRYEPESVTSGPVSLLYGMSPAGDVGGILEGATSSISTYDATGTTVTQTLCLVHDALGRLVLVGRGAASSGGPDALGCRTEGEVTEVVARFEYDALNRRVARTDGATGAKTQFAFLPGGETLGEYEATGQSASPWRTVREYVWLDGRPVAQEEHPSDTERHTYAIHVDSIGLPRALTNSSGQTVWRATARPYGDIEEATFTDPASGRTVVTNLRLPGQYDERLFAAAGISGLQGPYYNWNRWYLPSVGRYLELDPIALAGGFNGVYGPNWYGYAEGNPLRWTDPWGLEAEMCYRMFSPVPLPLVRHCYVRFNDNDTMSYDNTRVAPDQGWSFLPRTCTKASGPENDACVKKEMKKCDPKAWDITAFNCCHCVEQALGACGLSVPVDAWPNWPINPGPQPGEPGYCADKKNPKSCEGK